MLCDPPDLRGRVRTARQVPRGASQAPNVGEHVMCPGANTVPRLILPTPCRGRAPALPLDDRRSPMCHRGGPGTPGGPSKPIDGAQRRDGSERAPPGPAGLHSRPKGPIEALEDVLPRQDNVRGILNEGVHVDIPGPGLPPCGRGGLTQLPSSVRRLPSRPGPGLIRQDAEDLVLPDLATPPEAPTRKPGRLAGPPHVALFSTRQPRGAPGHSAGRARAQQVRQGTLMGSSTGGPLGVS